VKERRELAWGVDVGVLVKDIAVVSLTTRLKQ
jgi:hypothetical protein